MKNIFYTLLALFVHIGLFAQNNDNKTVEYATDAHIHYYPEKMNKEDAYMNEKCVLDVYYPKNTKGYATIVWIHGGGLADGGIYIPEGLKAKGFAIVSIDYRLYPKIKCPTFLEDAAAATAWVVKNIERYGGDPKLIVMSGHSAGAYLSCMITLDKKWLKPYDVDPDKFAAVISCSTQAITHFAIRKERGGKDLQATIDEFAPVYHVRPDAPPFVLIMGDREMELFGRYEENAYFARMFKLVGHKSVTLYELGGYSHNMVEPSCGIIVNEMNKIVAASKK